MRPTATAPWADNEIGERHHPSGGEADGSGENGRRVGDLARGIGHRDYKLSVDPADRKQQRAADYESEDCAERTAAEQPVVHDDEPADANHGAPSECEIVCGAEFAGEGGQEVAMR